MRRAMLWTGLLLLPLLQARVLGAQQIQRAFERWDERSLPALTPADAGAPSRKAVEAPRRDYRYEGLLVGGLALGAAGAWIGSQIKPACPLEPSNECDGGSLGDAVAVGLVGAAVGGGFGYLIGRLSGKPIAAAGTVQP